MRILFMLLLATTVLGANAQQISGFAKDGEGKPVGGATISLLKDTGSAVLKLALTKENGAYSFTDIKPGNYRVSASHVAFQPFLSAPFAVGAGDLTVNGPDMKLAKSSGDLKGVVVTAKKPLVEVKADKTILNVEGTINATGSDALELLRKSPGVQVDKDENLAVNGKNGVQVYIDGRPTPLTGQDLSNYLKTMQSSQIEAIEIITNPSAKYEAAGNAGIINIRLKKNKSFGTNGTVNAGWNIGTYAKYNAGASLNFRNKNVNLFGNYSYNQGDNINSISLYRALKDTIFDQHGQMLMTNRSHNFKAGMDYFINAQSTIGLMVNGNLADPRMSNHSSTDIIVASSKNTDRILTANNSSVQKRNNLNYNLNYSYNAKDGKSLTLNADYGTYDNNSDQLQPNTYYNTSGQVTRKVTYEMLAPTTINISSFKVDYEQNFAKGKLGFGGKSSYVKTDNDFQRYNVLPTGNELDKDASNRFKYTENINALYVNYNRAWKGVMIQAGLRAENTISKGTSTGLKKNGTVYENYQSGFKRNYTDLFPSAAITFNKNPMSQVGLTFSRRIDRPAYQDLNPFEFKLDEYTFQKGNVNLRPQYTNSFGISHTYKYRLNTSLNYSHVKDIFTQLIDTVETSKSFISKKNLATQDIISLSVSYPFSYKAYSVFANLSSNYSFYKADFGTGRKIDLKSFGLTIYAQNSIKFAKTWTGELTAFYNAPTIYQGAFKGKSLWAVDAGVQKQLWNNKATVKASVSDIFHTLHFRGEQDFAGQLTKVDARWESRQFKLSMIFRFGSNQVKAARQRSGSAEDETKRAQQAANGGIGIGQQ